MFRKLIIILVLCSAASGALVWERDYYPFADGTTQFRDELSGSDVNSIIDDLYLRLSIYDVLEDAFVDGNDTAYAASWNGNINAPSMNVVYDRFVALDGIYMAMADYDVLDDDFVDGNDTAYAASWNGIINAPSMNVVYDEFVALAGDYLAIDGSNANQDVNISSSYDFYAKTFNDVYIQGVATGNIGLGDTDTLSSITSGDYNVAIGAAAGNGLTSGSYNVAMGTAALSSGTFVGSNNFALGGDSMYNAVDCTDNVGLGRGTLYGDGASTHEYNYNVAIGATSGYSIDTGEYNVLIGYASGVALTDGDENVVIGDNAGNSLTVGMRNSLFGSATGFNLTEGTDNVFLGYNAGATQTTLTDLLIIDNRWQANPAADITNALIYGTFDATPASQTIRFNAGTTTLLGDLVLANADTTLARASAGVVTIAGTNIAMAGGAFHDGFSDFVGNEHLDWTQDLGAVNIHAGNYSDTQLSEEEVEDFVGGMVTGGTETLIGVTYTDGGVGAGVLNFIVDSDLHKYSWTNVVDADITNTLTSSACTGNAATVTTNANLTGEVTSVGNAATIADTVTVTGWTMGASAATTPAENDNDTSLATTAYVQTEIAGFISATLTQEEVEDYAGALITDGTGTHTGIAVTYQDGTADVDMVVDHDTASNYVADKHVAHSGVTITAGAGLTGTHDIATSFTLATDGVLEDLDTLGASGSDGQFIVATGIGAFQYEATTTARTSLGVGTGDSPAFANVSLGTGELTTGSINRASGTLTVEIGGTAEQSITATETTFGGNLVIPDGGYIGSASDTDALSIASDGVITHAAAADNNWGQYSIVSPGNNAGLSFKTGGGATMRNWQLQSNYQTAGGLSLMISPDNTSAPTTPIIEINSSGNMGFGSTTPDAKLQVVGGLKVGDDNTNFTAWSTAAGLQTMTGNARVISDFWVDAGGIKAPGANPATEATHGLLELPVWRFGDALVAARESISASFKLPPEMDMSVAPVFCVGWSTTTIYTNDASDNETIQWQLEYLYTQMGETTAAAAEDTKTVSYTLTAATAAEGLVTTSFAAMDVPHASDVCVHMRLTRLSNGPGPAGTDTIADDVELHGLVFQFTMNKLGTAL